LEHFVVNKSGVVCTVCAYIVIVFAKLFYVSHFMTRTLSVCLF